MADMSPLRGVLREAWATYRAYAGHFLLIAFALYLIAAIIGALLTFAAGNVGAAVGSVIRRASGLDVAVASRPMLFS